MHQLLSRAFALWLPIVIATSGIFLFSYWAVQQSYRLGANDPQIQMAEDGVAALNAGAPPASLVDRNQPLIDTATSLAPWIAVFDSSGMPLESSARLGEEPLHLPAGVFDITTWKSAYAAYGVPLPIAPKETRFSWQPSPDMREAVVLMQAENGYFVAAGRNMREVENRVILFTKGAAFLWGASELATLAAVLTLLAFGLL